MNKIGLVHAYLEKSGETSKSIKIRGMASTTDVDRAGDIMDPSCWKGEGLANYSKNPIILFNHDYDRPIGQATNLSVKTDGLEIEAEISKTADIAPLIESGVLKAFSVGFRIKDADWLEETGGLHIKEVELYEISVVSVPANQTALFEAVKCFSPGEFDSYRKGLEVPTLGNAVEDSTKVDKSTEGKSNTMTDKTEDANIASKISAAVKTALAEEKAKREAIEKAEKEAAEADKARLEAATKAAVEAGASGAEKLVEEVRKAFEEGRAETQKEVEDLKAQLIANKEEVMNFTKSKRQFLANGEKDWEKAFEKDITDAYVLGAITHKGFDTKFGKELMEKVNTMSGIEAPAAASTAVFENIASTAVERDIQNRLVLAPLFREVQMNSATMVFPILPDAGYAEFTTATGGAAYTGGKGNLRARGDALTGPANGVDLTQKVLSTHKLMSVSFLANDTEEDMILPVMPLLQESMSRTHARAVEHALLLGGHSTAVNTGGFDGLVEIGKDNSNNVQDTAAFASAGCTAAILLNQRKQLGKYGIRPQDVIYLVNQRSYYELLEDPEYQDVNLVSANLATKVTGEVGRIFGSPVVLVDEFNTPAVSEFYCGAVNPMNYVIPRLRGITLESDYVARLQHRELIATQRLGFSEIITGATAFSARNYSASAT